MPDVGESFPARGLRRHAPAGLAAALAVAGMAVHASAAPAPARGPGPGPAPKVVYGIYPGGAAGTVGPSGDTKPEDPALRLASLERLRGNGGRPFVLHLYDAFTRREDAAALPGPLAEQIAGYTARGFQVELALTYRPADPQGDVDGFVEFVRRRVQQLGPDPGVTSLQVTNEANVPNAPNAADGAYPGARAALVRGVVAAGGEARAGGYGGLRVGFNWAYQTGPAERAFWSELGRTGGPAFTAAVDWVGIDVYPGTWGPRLRRGDLGSAARTQTVRALRVLRDDLLRRAGLARVALHVSEAGYPTGPGRTERMQAAVLRAVTGEIAGGRHGVTGFRWFDLRDADSSARSFESRYGLVRDDYRPKRAFETYRRIIAARE